MELAVSRWEFSYGLAIISLTRASMFQLASRPVIMTADRKRERRRTGGAVCVRALASAVIQLIPFRQSKIE